MGGKTGTSTSTVSIPPEVLARYNAVNAQAEQVAQTPFQPYTGQFVAGITPTQQAGINATTQYSQAAQPYYQAATGAAFQGGQAVDPRQLNISQFMSPYTSQVAEATANMLRQQQGQQTTQQEANAIMSGAFGGDRSNLAAAQLAGQQNLAMAQAMAPIYQQGYTQALQAAQQQQGVYLTADQANRAAQQQLASQLAGLGTGAQQSALQGAQAQIGAGTLEQQTQQADLTARYQQFLQERGYPFQVAQFLANIAMGTGALSGSTTTSQYPMPFFSDERLKEDVKEIGKTNDGQPIYSFKYKGRPGTQIGLMAQDVEKRHPEAVYETEGGIKAVDYKAATKGAEMASGGIVPEGSMGGAVMRPGAYGRGGFADGGSAYDPDFIRAILVQQKEGFGPFSEGGVYGQRPATAPFAGKGVVPAASLPVASLKTAAPPEQGKSGVSQVQSALDMADKLGSAYSKASKLSDWWSGKDEDETNKAYGGGIAPRHAYALSGAVTKKPVIPGEDTGYDYFPEDILDVSTASNQTDPQKTPQPTSQSGIGLGTLASIFGLFLKNGGAVPRRGFATDGFVNPDFIFQEEEFGQMIDPRGIGAGAKLPDLPQGRKIEPSVAGLDTTADIVANALSSVESSGNYGALGPVANKSGDRAYGKYQIMGANVPVWTEKYLGKAMSPDEFLADNEAQDALMRARVKEQLAQGYDPKDIASIHFTGTTADKAGNRKDVLGTTTPAYIAKFNRAMGGPEQSGVLPSFASAELPEGRAKPSAGVMDALASFMPSASKSGEGVTSGLTDYFRQNQGWLVPLGAGLKSMVQSRSPFLGAAMLEGVGGGLEAIGASQKQLADLAEAKGRTTEMLSRIPLDALIGEIDPATGKMSWRVRPDYFAGKLAKKSGTPTDKLAETQKQAITKAEEAVTGVPAPSPVEMAPSAPIQSQVVDGKYNFSVTPSTNADATFSEFGYTGDPNDAYTVRATMGSRPELVNQSKVEEEKAKGRQEAAMNSTTIRNDTNMLTDAVMGISETGAAGQGPGQSERARLVAIYNWAVKNAGMEGNTIDENSNIANSEIIRKLQQQAGVTRAGAAGFHAASIAQAINEAQPSGELTQEASAKLLASMYVQNQLNDDFNRYYNDYIRKYGSAYKAEENFMKDFGQQYQREKEIIPQLLKPTIKLKDGRMVSPAQLLRMNPDKALEFERQYNVPGLSRLFLGG